MRESVRLAALFLVTLVLAFALYYTSIWMLAILAGLVASLPFGRRYLADLPVSFVAGLLSSVLFIYINFVSQGAPAIEEAYYASAVAGLPGNVIFTLTVLASGVYCIIGSIIGLYIKKAASL